jgi:hypothetical protein
MIRRFVCAICLLGVTGCVFPHHGPIQTEVITFPKGGIVEYNGRRMGKEPVTLVLPQDSAGWLTNRVEVRALPSDESLYAQSRVLDPATRYDRVPSRILIDLSAIPDTPNKVDLVQREEHIEKQKARDQRKPGPKPTRPVGGY